MKRSTKIVTIIIIFFLVITAVIVGRAMIGKHFQKKFGKRPPPGIIVTEVVQKEFSEKIESFGTAVSKKTEIFRIKKNQLLSELNLKEYVELKRKRVIESLSYEIKVGMSFYEVELILGQPNSIVEDSDYDLWIYEKSEKTFKTYFFKNNILVKIN